MFPYAPLPGETRDDLFYFTETNRIVHAFLEFKPIVMRIYPEIPVNKKQYALYGKVAQSVDRDFGWFRGGVEFIFLPNIHIGWTFSNKTNMDFYTMFRFKYAEYTVEPILNTEHLLKILMRQAPSYEITFPAIFPFDELQYTIDRMGVPMIPRPKPYYSTEEIKSIIEESLKAHRR